jgi:methylphosphotriester-DNA--protein-cysteine methyltransferase
MWVHSDLTNGELKNLITSNQIQLGGNARLKIYGTLSCLPGKRMKKINRVFFNDEHEAKHYGFRPCGHCLREKYQKWKMESSKDRVENRPNSFHL